MPGAFHIFTHSVLQQLCEVTTDATPGDTEAQRLVTASQSNFCASCPQVSGMGGRGVPEEGQTGQGIGLEITALGW